MEKKYEIKLVLADDLSDQDREITTRYWLIKDGSFKEKVSKIARNFPLYASDVSRIGKKNGYLIISIPCCECATTYEINTYSQTETKRYLRPTWQCDSCIQNKIELEEKKIELERNKIKQTRLEKFNQGISNESWKKLNRQELHFLLQMLGTPTINDLLEGLRSLKGAKYWEVLQKADDLGLVDLVKEDRYYFTEFYCPDDIEEYINNYLEAIREVQPELKNDTALHPKLGFKMFKNHEVRSEDDALYYGDVSFDRDIIIKAGTLYTYSVWQRKAGDAWLSIIPSETILKSKSTRSPSSPKKIGALIKRWKY